MLLVLFEQKISSAATVPGTVADYDSAAARMQFKRGVAAALEIEVSAVSDLVISAAGDRRRLQSGSVSIAYTTTLTDPGAAAAD